jgi:hypothetical protein
MLGEFLSYMGRQLLGFRRVDVTFSLTAVCSVANKVLR